MYLTSSLLYSITVLICSWETEAPLYQIPFLPCILQMGSLYGDGGAGYGGQDMYGMQGGYGGGGGAPMQYPPMYGQPQVQQGYGGYGGKQPPGANLRQARHQRYGGQNSSGW